MVQAGKYLSPSIQHRKQLEIKKNKKQKTENRKRSRDEYKWFSSKKPLPDDVLAKLRTIVEDQEALEAEEAAKAAEK